MQRHMRLMLCVLATLGLTVPAVRADDSKNNADPAKQLADLIGSWDVTITYKLPDGTEHQGKAACVARRVLNDRFIQQDYKSTVNQKPLVVWQLIGYDSLKKRFVEIYLNAHGNDSHTMSPDGGFSDDGKVLTLRGDTINGFTGKPAKLRAATTIKDHDHFTIEWYLTGDGGKENRTVVLSHTRKK